MLVWHRADLHSMLEHDHHAGWRSVIVHDEVNMLNHNAASDGGESNRVSDGYASGTRACTVCYSALVMGEERSCSADGAPRVCLRFGMPASFLLAVLIYFNLTLCYVSKVLFTVATENECEHPSALVQQGCASTHSYHTSTV